MSGLPPPDAYPFLHGGQDHLQRLHPQATRTHHHHHRRTIRRRPHHPPDHPRRRRTRPRGLPRQQPPHRRLCHQRRAHRQARSQGLRHGDPTHVAGRRRRHRPHQRARPPLRRHHRPGRRRHRGGRGRGHHLSDSEFRRLHGGGVRVDVGRGGGHNHPHGGVPAPVRGDVPPDPSEARRPRGHHQREEHGQQVFRVGCPGRPPPRRLPRPPEPRIEVRRLRDGARHGRHRVPRRHRGHRALRGPERGVGQRLRVRGRRHLPSPPNRATRPATRQPAPTGRRGEEALSPDKEFEPSRRPTIRTPSEELPVRLLPARLLPGRPPR